MIYFIECVGYGLVKIGHTGGNPIRRLRAIQHASPFELEVIGVIPGGRSDEKEMHERFDDIRCRREWFYKAKRLIEFIEDSGAARRFSEINQSELRLLLSAGNQRTWRRDVRDEWNSVRKSLTSNYALWTAHEASLDESDVSSINAFLDRNGLRSSFERDAA